MTVPEAIEVAKKHLASILPELSGAELTLEELEVPPYGNKWRFTFSGTFLPKEASTLAQVLRQRRISKSVEIDPETGDLLAVRNIAA